MAYLLTRNDIRDMASAYCPSLDLMQPLDDGSCGAVHPAHSSELILRLFPAKAAGLWSAKRGKPGKVVKFQMSHLQKVVEPVGVKCALQRSR